MTCRERFYKTMTFSKPDRIPYFEEGIRNDVLKAWHKQGLSPQIDLSQLFTTDHFEEIAPELDPIPELDKWPISSRELDSFKKRLNPYTTARLPINWTKKIPGLKTTDQVIFLRVYRGFFLSMGVNKWSRFSEVISLLMDNPDLVHQILKLQAEFAVEMSERILKEIPVDAVIFSEPIGGNEGPLISPEMYSNFVLNSLGPLFEMIKKYKIETIIFRTYANARALIPCILDYGFNCLWACETNIEAMDYRIIRKEFGQDLRLLGGIDLDALRQGEQAIRLEIEKKVPPLIAEGGYIPMADGRIRRDISFENYSYYRNLLEKITSM